MTAQLVLVQERQRRRKGEKASALSVVIPVYNEHGNILPLISSLRDVLSSIKLAYEVILVDDGSTDGSWLLIRKAHEIDRRVKGVSLSRNFGHQNAIFTGLHYASGAAVITMDADLQHPPECLPELVKAWKQGSMIVETSRLDASSPPLKRLTSRLFYRCFSVLSGIPMPPGTSDFRLMDRRVVEAVKGMRDADLFLRGISHWVGFPHATVTYKAKERFSGSTKYSLRQMIKFAVSSLLAFSAIPLRLGIWVGLFTSLLAFAELVYIVLRVGQGEVVPGWASTLGVISFMFGILFILVGILGSYLASIFETMKNRPRFLVNETIGFE